MKEPEEYIITCNGANTSKEAIVSIIDDLFPKENRGCCGGGALENAVCAAASARRLSLLGFYKSSSVSVSRSATSPTATSVTVDVVEPQMRWAMGLHTSASPGRHVSAALEGSLRNVFGSMARIDARAGLGNSESDVVGEVAVSKPVFCNGGRRKLLDWLSKQTKARGNGGGNGTGRAADTEDAVRVATGNLSVVTVGVHAVSEDRSAVADVRRHIASVFASVRAGVLGTFTADVSFFPRVTAGPRAHPEVAEFVARGSCSNPVVRAAHTAAFEHLSNGADPDVGFSATLTSEAAVEIPRSRAAALSGNEFVRETAACQARVPLGAGCVLVLLAKAGALFGLRGTEPTRVAAALEGFTNGSDLVRCVTVAQKEPVESPVSAYASFSAMISAPLRRLPFVMGRPICAHAFVDAGGVTESPSLHSVVENVFRRPRASAGVGLSLPLGSGRIEFNFATPLTKQPQDMARTFDFGSTFPSLVP